MFSEGVENNRKKWIDLLVLLKFLKKTSQRKLCRRFAIFNLLYADMSSFLSRALFYTAWIVQLGVTDRLGILWANTCSRQRRQNIVYRHCLYFRFGTGISQQDTEVYLEPSQKSMMEFFSKNS